MTRVISFIPIIFACSLAMTGCISSGSSLDTASPQSDSQSQSSISNESYQEQSSASEPLQIDTSSCPHMRNQRWPYRWENTNEVACVATPTYVQDENGMYVPGTMTDVVEVSTPIGSGMGRFTGGRGNVRAAIDSQGGQIMISCTAASTDDGELGVCFRN